MAESIGHQVYQIRTGQRQVQGASAPSIRESEAAYRRRIVGHSFPAAAEKAANREWLRQERVISLRRKQQSPIPAPSPWDRLADHLLDLGEQAISTRRLDRPAGWGTSYGRAITSYSAGERLWVISGSGFHRYSSRAGSWHTGASYLIGRDQDGSLFAVRIPSSILSVAEALEWLMPAQVRRAPRVIRQGDLYLIPAGRMNMDGLRGSRHSYNKETRTITHPEHPAITLPAGNWRAVPQRVLNGAAGDND
jgi:hypothetical protein